MKPAERDELLIRLDERSNNTWRILQEQDDKLDKIIVHQEKANGKINKNRIMIMSLIAFLSGAGILDATVFHRVIGG